MEEELLDLTEPRQAHSLLDQPLVVSVATCTDDLNKVGIPNNMDLSHRFLDDLNRISSIDATQNIKQNNYFSKKP